ncbi:clan AA aspartic protease [compost metagenome]
MNEAQAQRLGLDFRVNGQAMMVNTASGVAKAWRMTLDRVKVGGLEVLGVDAIMMEGGSPADVLLGMSYLNRVGWREDQGMLILESKH